MSDALQFQITSRCRQTQARVGRIETLHGGFDTPAFMPVGTKATVKGLMPEQIAATGSQILLNNAYHLLLRPGDEMVAERGVHEFMRWSGPILTDSGGYQAFSMADINSLDDEGVTFKSIIDGSRIHLGPERSMSVQNNLGADIIMAFDDCPPAGDPAEDGPAAQAAFRHRLEEAVDRTTRWLHRCVQAHARSETQSLFGIVQGGPHEDLRARSAKAITEVELPGYAIGGVATGETPEVIHRIVAFTAPLLPEEKPRYLMGVGYERDLLAAVRAGVDMFDCVLPTRNGRNAGAFTRNGRIQLRNAKFREDDNVIDPSCDCVACSGGFSRAYIRHLFQAGEMLGAILVSQHNLRHFQRLMLDIRRAIREDAWSCLHRAWPVLEQDSTEGKMPL
ncbi:MAG: tRNA guanosine(34) transglycosylase Tgt [Phycisphaerales bacterium]|nr:tRNA guanosine(34) transglycosylase Tgt [Phycisphaerales bacterium]